VRIKAAVGRAAAFVPDHRIVDPRPVDIAAQQAARTAGVVVLANQRVAVIEEARRRLAAIGGADHRE